MPHLSQLGLVIRRQELDELRLLRQGDPRSLSSLEISELFTTSPYGLLLVRGRIENRPLILACVVPLLSNQFSSNERYIISENPFSTAGIDTDCIVQLLPTHRVLRSTSKVAQVKTTGSAVDPGDLLIDLGRVKMQFAKGLDRGMLEFGLERVSFSVELMEVWGR